MAFVTYLIQMIVKMIFVGAASFAGIMLGKRLRDRKDAKKAVQEK
ncbi:hypothetical protein BRYFOR_09525 [Marvinbryantia formatexigens DSM 14469]|uniref:Uncharacterized protein n=1 Tax=Marvinbryantia formatexigens DSM 14469 TaxID=478749 RepID=C6LLH8_9FIRM|nr:hypothetical protein [Marvinbryantia formatexigens]EET58518.1 hypothetical protein BRYFOR_09525 [Marvinbryantia formatexigens DSM 14469]UWO24911.1 hypothetical protein NQ534_21330 [Marvinbryantia formatexigens DSM 14469]SDH15321.1 hypothetical protein SAMN05660368_03932 [Marvinbryantia formatexigens]